MRDDFSQRTKDLLANRVGWKCSNPNCRKATRGAGIGKENIINIGVASHITAASKGGPRYDENITSQERASAENGIWLCQSCSKLIDSDVNRYTIAKLKKWKEISEQMAILDLEEATAEEQHEDKELIKFFQTVDKLGVGCYAQHHFSFKTSFLFIFFKINKNLTVFQPRFSRIFASFFRFMHAKVSPAFISIRAFPTYCVYRNPCCSFAVPNILSMVSFLN